MRGQNGAILGGGKKDGRLTARHMELHRTEENVR
jgi:hypothetical protein